MVFRATKMFILCYFEKQGNPCPSFRDCYFGDLGFQPNFPTKLEKT